MLAAEELIGYSFKNKALLNQALTHPSFGMDYHVPHYQRLEFLGDAVLELHISELLYAAHPELSEGMLTRMRADLVCEASLSKALRDMGLNQFIRLSVGETRSGGRDKPSIQCDVFEAIIGAMYMDGANEEANRFIDTALKSVIENGKPEDRHIDYKSSLQELLQAKGGMPVYELVEATGPAHKPVFTYRVMSGGEELGCAEGGSKQQAQLNAAKQALEKLQARTE